MSERAPDNSSNTPEEQPIPLEFQNLDLLAIANNVIKNEHERLEQERKLQEERQEFEEAEKVRLQNAPKILEPWGGAPSELTLETAESLKEYLEQRPGFENSEWADNLPFIRYHSRRLDEELKQISKPEKAEDGIIDKIDESEDKVKADTAVEDEQEPEAEQITAEEEAAEQAEATKETPAEEPATEELVEDAVELPEAEPAEADTREEVKISLEDVLLGINYFGAKLKDKDYVPTADEYRLMVGLGNQIEFTQKTENGPFGYYIGGMKQNAYACRSFLDGIRADRWLLTNDDKTEGELIISDVKHIVDLENQPKQRIQNYDLLKFNEFERIYEQKHNADDEEEILTAYKQYVQSRLELDGRLSEQNPEANKANAQNLYSEALNEFTESRPDNRAKKAKIRESLGYIASGLKRRR